MSSDFAKCRPYVIRIRIKWLTKRFYTHAYTDEIDPDTDTDDNISPNVIYLVPFFIRIRNADTDTDPETWNKGLIQQYNDMINLACNGKCVFLSSCQWGF